MNGFEVLIKNWLHNEDGSKEDLIIHDDEESLQILGGYLCLGLNGKLKIAESQEGGMDYRDFPYEYELIM